MKKILTLLLFLPLLAYSQTDFTIENGDVKLPGTLCDVGDKSAPVVVFVHGSGPNDRDETIGPNKFFKELAQKFMEKGISSLRYDKRTMLYKTGGDTITYKEETVDDAVKAVEQLKNSGYTHIFVAGHSLGGHCTPLIADACGDKLNGVIVLSGNVGSLESCLKAQLEHLGQAQYLDAMLAKLPTKYLEFDRSYSPLTRVKETNKKYPSLKWMVVGGGHDYQVTIADFTLWRMTLGNSATYFWGDKLDHILRPLPEMAKPQDYMVEGHVDDSAVEAMAKFILDRTSR